MAMVIANAEEVRKVTSETLAFGVPCGYYHGLDDRSDTIDEVKGAQGGKCSTGWRHFILNGRTSARQSDDAGEASRI